VKKSKQIKDFLIVWFVFFIVFGMFILMERLIPEFGYRIEAGEMVRIFFGLLVLAVAWQLNKKFRITK
jgi:hypothetical protein